MSDNRLLPEGTVLEKRYQIGEKIGEGGFGITYSGMDTQLHMEVAIKEYFPASLAKRDVVLQQDTRIHVLEGKNEQFQGGLLQFEREMNHLVSFGNQLGTTSIRDFFSANGTSYIVMDFARGKTLKEYCMENGPMPEKQVLSVMYSVMKVLCDMHQAGLLHRDVSPDNIIVDNRGKVKLVDFGSVRRMKDRPVTEAVVFIKRGFAPLEQYRSRSSQGPWTDVFGVCATLYYMLTGHVPPDVLERMKNDQVKRPDEWGIMGISGKTVRAVMKGLSLKEEERYMTMLDLMRALYG